nr:MAG: Rne/Rng family ribonuclease [Hyphomicrobiales bacterium]
MTQALLIHSGIAELEIALLKDGVLERYWSETSLEDDESQTSEGQSRVGDVVLARIKRVLPALNAAFVDIGDERDGFLSVRDAAKRGSGPREDDLKIGSLVREGEARLVQVLRDAIGEKGARIGLNIALAGRFLVFSPDGGKVLLSRRIEDEAERVRLKSIFEAMEVLKSGAGIVVRTAAIGASEEALREDAEYLAGIWEDIVEAQEEDEPPVTLHHELGFIERALRDKVGPEIERVIVDDRAAFNAARAYAVEAMPDFSEKIVLHEGPSPLFADHGIDEEIAALQLSEILLANGGWITIEPTEALTAVDVNSGKHIARSDLEATALAVNTEAAEAIARQLILRGIGGLIVIDFIPMTDGFDRLTEMLAEKLKQAGIQADAARMEGMNIVALTIKHMRASVDRRATEPCTLCDGHGRRRSVSAIARQALRQVERAAAAAPGRPIAMRVGSEIAAWLEARSGQLKSGFSRKGITALRVFPEAQRARDSFSIETMGKETPV